jgi:hypothetical protein
MSRRAGPQVVTANDLFTGEAVWRTQTGDWSPRLSEAEIHAEPELADAALAAASAEGARVVGAYLAGVESGSDGPRPAHFREAFRTRGPSNYPHGKQAEV